MSPTPQPGQTVLVQRSAAQLRCSPASGSTRRLLFSMLLQRHRGNARWRHFPGRRFDCSAHFQGRGSRI